MVARETAPAAAEPDMFEGDPDLSQKGGLAVAVPGEMKGYWELYKRFGGGVPWKDLILPTVAICENGYEVTTHTANALRSRRDEIRLEPSLKEILWDSNTDDIYKLGDNMTRPILAKTLRTIAEDSVNGGNLLYQRNSKLAQDMIADLQGFGSIITMEDLENYKVEWVDPIEVELNRTIHLHTIPLPGSGTLVAFMLRILTQLDLAPLTNNCGSEEDKSATTYHLILEAMKHAYGRRTNLGDPIGDEEIREEMTELVRNLTLSEDYLQSVLAKISPTSTSANYDDYGAEFYSPDDHGTSHMSIVGPNGDAIAITSTINVYFGARIRSRKTGIIFNDEMDDFSSPNITNAFGVPPSPNNFIKPGKRPMSSMCPSIFTDDQGDVRLVIGSSGGTRITTATTYASLRNLFFGDSLEFSINSPRVHHQLSWPEMEAEMEPQIPMACREGVEAIGHNTTEMTEIAPTQGVARSDDGIIWAHCDKRKPCSVDGF